MNEMESILNEPVSRTLVRLYNQAGMDDKIINVYNPFMEKYPSTVEYINDITKNVDSIGSILSMRSKLEMVEPMVAIIQLTDIHFTIEGTELADLEDVKAVFSGIVSLKEKTDILHLREMSRLVEYVSIIKEMSDEYNLPPRDIVKEQKYRDEILKRLFPIRDLAENYFMMDAQIRKDMLNTTYAVASLIVQTSSPSATFNEEFEKIPKKEEIDDLGELILQFNIETLDRVYGVKADF